MSRHCSPIHWGNDTNPCPMYGDVVGTVGQEMPRTGGVTSDYLFPVSQRDRGNHHGCCDGRVKRKTGQIPLGSLGDAAWRRPWEVNKLRVGGVEGQEGAFQMGLLTPSPNMHSTTPLLHNFYILGSWLGWRAK